MPLSVSTDRLPLLNSNRSEPLVSLTIELVNDLIEGLILIHGAEAGIKRLDMLRAVAQSLEADICEEIESSKTTAGQS